MFERGILVGMGCMSGGLARSIGLVWRLPSLLRVCEGREWKRREEGQNKEGGIGGPPILCTRLIAGF